MLEWKNNHRNTCLVIIGARQVGKTFIIREFAKNNYDRVYEFNFLENSLYNEFFHDDLSVNTILKNVT